MKIPKINRIQKQTQYEAAFSKKCAANGNAMIQIHPK